MFDADGSRTISTSEMKVKRRYSIQKLASYDVSLSAVPWG